MPLDSGEGAEPIMVANGSVGAREGISLESLLLAGANIGQALKALREAQNLTLVDIADATCVRRYYLQAIEDMQLDRLPVGPFSVGYVRAYAQALGARSELAVAHFRKAVPSGAEALKAPVGVQKERDPRLSWLAGACVVVTLTVLCWNLAQHAVAHDGSPTPPVPVANVAAPAPAAKGLVALAAAQPAPADTDVPTPYVTPGMAKAVGGVDAPPAAPARKAALNPRATVYGAPAAQAALTLQALRAASLVIRGSDGSIYFARQLAAGESFRAPAGVRDLTIDVSEPQAFSVIVPGQPAASLQTMQTPISKLIG